MRAYEPGERWRASGSAVLDADGDMRARTSAGVTRVDEALARLIAESPERDELLRDLFEYLESPVHRDQPGVISAEAADFCAGIRATLARTEDLMDKPDELTEWIEALVAERMSLSNSEWYEASQRAKAGFEKVLAAGYPARRVKELRVIEAMRDIVRNATVRDGRVTFREGTITMADILSAEADLRFLDAAMPKREK